MIQPDNDMLTRETFEGPWAGLPVAWAATGALDEASYRAAVARCCDAGIPGVYSGGTTGEFYAMEFEDFQRVARVTVEECHARGTPAMIGCTATSARGATKRAAYAADIGADAVQVALPFWLEVPDAEVVPFFQAVSDAAQGLPLSIYDTLRTKKALSVDLHRAIKETLPNYVMVKATAGTVGCT
ncbi:MAG: dihydrodipicolinate synthase family protein, partial [Candidatus Hydrogenedentota bacterium]